jgi:hypothetical protein
VPSILLCVQVGVCEPIDVTKISHRMTPRNRIRTSITDGIYFIVLFTVRKYTGKSRIRHSSPARLGYLAKQMYKVLTVFSCNHREIGEALVIINSTESAYPVPSREPHCIHMMIIRRESKQKRRFFAIQFVAQIPTPNVLYPRRDDRFILASRSPCGSNCSCRFDLAVSWSGGS